MLTTVTLAAPACSLTHRPALPASAVTPANVALVPLHGIWLPDPAALAAQAQTLSPRLSVLQIRDRRTWSAVAAAIPAAAAEPDFTHGCVVGLISRAGRPLNGNAPLALSEVVDFGDVACLSGQFRGGSFLPDGSAYLALAWAETRSPLLSADIDGQVFVIDPPDATRPTR